MTTHLTRRLAAAGELRQDEAVRRADALAAAVDRTVGHVWGQLLRLLRSGPHWGEGLQISQPLFASLLPTLQQQLARGLGRLADWSYQATANGLGSTLPTRALAAAVVQKHARTLSVQDLLGPRKLGLGPPAGSPREALADILFPPPTLHQVHRVVYAPGASGQPWPERLASLSRLATPHTLAHTVSAGLARGEGPRQIARQLLPAVDGVRSSARRIARTEGLRVAHVMQMEAHEQLGDLVIGYQVHSAHSPNSRSWHLKRDGTIYYKEPGEGQKGLYQMPRPPDEAPDPAERPPGTPATAPNCLCWLSPCLRPL